MELSTYFWGLHWAISTRNGAGFDIEALTSRATWGENSDGDLIAFPFSGIEIKLPLLVILIGNPAAIEED